MNQAVNFFWSILCFFPVVWFWLDADILMCYIFIGISVLSLLIPARILQISYQPKFYQTLFIKQIRKFVQNGDLVNGLIRRSKPTHRTIKAKADASRYLSTVVMYERFHFLCLIFFLLTTIYALTQAKFWLSFAVIIANVIYNICPILLQQYNRARVLKLTKK